MNRFVFVLLFVGLFVPALWYIPDAWFTALLLGIGIPHVLLGIKYSRKGLTRAWSIGWQKLFLLVLIPLSLYLGGALNVVVLIVYFGIHHALSEVYCQRGELHQNRYFIISYFFLILTSYFIACRSNFNWSNEFLYALVGLFLVSTVSTAGSVIWKIASSSKNTRKTLIDYPWLLASVILVGMSLIQPIGWEVLILFHFIYWGILPVFRKSMFEGRLEASRMFWKDAILWNGLGLVMMLSLAYWSSQEGNYYLLNLILIAFYMLTYFHISVSFIMSGSNPKWIRNLMISQ